MADKENIEKLLRGLESGDESALEQEFRALYAGEDRSFGEGFADRVMARKEAGTVEKGMDYFLPRLFKWVAVAGVAAAVALLAMVYLAEDNISIDALAGISQVSVEEVASLNL